MVQDGIVNCHHHAQLVTRKQHSVSESAGHCLTNTNRTGQTTFRGMGRTDAVGRMGLTDAANRMGQTHAASETMGRSKVRPVPSITKFVPVPLPDLSRSSHSSVM